MIGELDYEKIGKKDGVIIFFSKKIRKKSEKLTLSFPYLITKRTFVLTT